MLFHFESSLTQIFNLKYTLKKKKVYVAEIKTLSPSYLKCIA